MLDLGLRLGIRILGLGYGLEAQVLANMTGGSKSLKIHHTMLMD